MNAELNLRLKMFNRSLGVLDLPEHLTVWKGKAPKVFTKKAGEAASMAAELEAAQMNQEKQLTGAAEQKDREETELEDAAYALAQALVQWFTDTKVETKAAEVALTISDWRELRDLQLLATSQLVIDHAASVSSGPKAAEAADYGITAAAVQALTKERQDYDDIVNAPDVAVAVRKALTKGFRPAFALVERKFTELDRLIVQFATNDAGRALIAAWRDARIQKGANADGDKKKPAGGGTAPAPAPVQ